MPDCGIQAAASGKRACLAIKRQ